MSRSLSTRLVAIIAVVALFLVACGTEGASPSPTDETSPPDGTSPPTESPAGGEAEFGVDDGTVLTLWTRSVTADQTEALVEAYNATHENQVQVTVVPRDQALQVVAAAAGADDLPDLLGGNVIDGANYSSQGLWQDLTDQVNELPFADQLAPAHVRVGTWEDRIYAVPHVVDVSALYYNKVLFEMAGLDPDSPPTTLPELRDAAEQISALGPEYDGMYFPGNCAGCLVFITWPSIWASGGTVLSEDGASSTLDSEEAIGVYEFYNDLFHSGLMRPESEDEPGATQNEVWATGTIGFMLLGSKALGQVPESDDLEMGVAPIPGLEGGVSTFVGGDVMGISASSENYEQAWNFLAWTLTEEAQLEVYASNLFMPVRVDLADNEYTRDDERLATFNRLVEEGVAPYSANFFQCFNDPVAPWLTMARGAIFGDDVEGALTQGTAELDICLDR